MTRATLPREVFGDPAWFRTEMARLGEGCWQLFAFTDDLARPNDYVRRVLFGVDVFVQNFAGELRGYRNACAHRGFPLRRETRGHGPVQCGFHGWLYNREGVPTVIPRNRELFGLTPEDQKELALPAIRVESVGRFVFVALDERAPSLASHLGAYAPLIRALSEQAGALAYRDETVTRANWKVCFGITLDDYHIQTVHPDTFGASPPLPPHSFYYQRDGMHSCYLLRRDADWSFAPYFEDLAKGIVDRSGYKIHQVFPNFLFSFAAAGVVVCIYTPLDEGRTMVEQVLFPWADGALSAAALSDAWEAVRKVGGEDRVVCEHHQKMLGGSSPPQLLGRLEERVRWFYESYGAFMGLP